MADDLRPPEPLIPPVADEETRLYWDRLDAKFADLKGTPPSGPPPPPQAAGSAAAVPAPVSVPPLPAPASPASGLIADAFAALLALEDGQPGARPVRLTTGDGHPQPAAEPKITDAVIEDVVRRVIERIGPDAVRAVVVDVVSQISERLVKEEIERIRKQHV